MNEVERSSQRRYDTGAHPVSRYLRDAARRFTSRLAPVLDETITSRLVPVLDGTLHHGKGKFVALSIAPTQGSSGGGTTVTVTGTAGNMNDVTSVTFDGIPGTSLTHLTINTLSVVTPSGSGAVPVVATSPGGSSSAGTCSI